MFLPKVASHISTPCLFLFSCFVARPFEFKVLNPPRPTSDRKTCAWLIIYLFVTRFRTMPWVMPLYCVTGWCQISLLYLNWSLLCDPREQTAAIFLTGQICRRSKMPIPQPELFTKPPSQAVNARAKRGQLKPEQVEKYFTEVD